MMKARRASILFAVSLLAPFLPAARAGEDAERLQARAAEEAAREDLRGQVLATTIDAQGLTIRVLSDRAGSVDAVERAVSTADQLGGPRWIDGDTCQVKLRLSGGRVGDVIQALDRSMRLPATLADRTFVATGSSIRADRVNRFIPSDLPPAWRDISESDRDAAVFKARDAAAAAVEKRCRAIALAGFATEVVSTSKPVASGPKAMLDGTDRGGVDLRAFVSGLPVTRVNLKDDGQVEVALFVDRVGLTEHFSNMAGGAGARDENFAEKIRSLPAVVIGRSAVDLTPATAVPAAGQLALPARPPAWLRDPITAEFVAPFTQNKLRTARRAEAAAVGVLRARVEALAFNDTLSLGQAAVADARYRDALDRAIGQARAFKVDYRGDGSVAVSVTIDANELWGAMAEGR